MRDPYDIPKRVERVTRAIQNSRISTRNKKLIFNFAKQCYLDGLSETRVLFYLNRLWDVARLMEKDFDRITKRDVEKLVAKIRNYRNLRTGKPYAEWTVADILMTIKRFWKWLEGDGEDFPAKVRWIKPGYPKTHKLPEELLTKEEIEKLIEASHSVRDKALISILYETGCRIGEILNLRIRNAQFDDRGAVLIVNGKTGQRRLLIIHSVPRLLNWLDHHPRKTDPENFLFVSTGTVNHGERLRYPSVVTMVRRASKKANIRKRIYLHLFRHSRATSGQALQVQRPF